MASWAYKMGWADHKYKVRPKPTNMYMTRIPIFKNTFLVNAEWRDAPSSIYMSMKIIQNNPT